MKELFIKTEQQRQWLEKLATLEESIKQNAQRHDEESSFPHENIQKLREIGYPKLTLPKEYGGEGFNIYDAVLIQETLGSYDGSTALSIGWTLLTVGDVYETKGWPEEKLTEFAKAVTEGAIINKIVSEVITGSPIRGGRPGTNASKKDGKWVLNGRKAYATCSPELDYFLVTAWIPELENTGNFLIHKDTPGLMI
ncbi:MAG: acyl-CoA/acyl-ACP dehydrogenase, partial [Lysinibacillus sp.]|nr:acyl-CoA/acyl-ACP dehydrogenase [Lysinibacillus sp.]